MTGASLMFAEAGQAGAVVERLLAANRDVTAKLGERWATSPPAAVLTCARGSSDHAATYAKYLIETRLPLLVASAAPSTASVYRAQAGLTGALAIGISQSGRSPDILATMEAARNGGAETLALVNDTGSPLAISADAMLPLHAGPERSVAATKSYIATLAALAQLVAAWAKDEALAAALAALPTQLGEAWEQDWSPLVDMLVNARGLYVIGRGLNFGVAQEAALKLKEICGLHAEAFSAAEVRHGPMALVGPDFPLLVLHPADEAADSVDLLVSEVVTRGAPVLLAGGPEAADTTPLPVARAHPAIQPILAIQSFYRAAEALSRTRGFDPDRPPSLSKVTETV